MTPTLRPLHAYEPTGLVVAELDPAERWAGPRPLTVPQVTAEPSDFSGMLTKMLEVLDGRRHLGQLRTLLTDSIYEATQTRLRMIQPTGVRYTLASIHACWPTPDAVELNGRVETNHRGSTHRRAQAVVVRLERRESGWLCVFWRLL